MEAKTYRFRITAHSNNGGQMITSYEPLITFDEAKVKARELFKRLADPMMLRISDENREAIWSWCEKGGERFTSHGINLLNLENE